jgi:hypothetical protein
MGLYSYMCRCCNQDIRRDEKCVLIHHRHGEELGRVTGSYNGYGGVFEDNAFCSQEVMLPNGQFNPNSRDEISESEDREDAYSNDLRVLPDGTVLSMMDFSIALDSARFVLRCQESLVDMSTLVAKVLTDEPIAGTTFIKEMSMLPSHEIKKRWRSLPIPEMPFSGIAAFHEKCFSKLNEDICCKGRKSNPSNTGKVAGSSVAV